MVNACKVDISTVLTKSALAKARLDNVKVNVFLYIFGSILETEDVSQKLKLLLAPETCRKGNYETE